MKIEISISEQQLTFTDGDIKLTYPVSTSKYGEGFKESSMKTPTGLFEISQKIGGRAPYGAVFESRKFTGKIAKINHNGEKDIITSRILRLKGFPMKNSNTIKRYIYIHGTNDETTIGIKASIGCIRMKNEDIIELYKYVKKGCKVRII